MQIQDTLTLAKVEIALPTPASHGTLSFLCFSKEAMLFSMSLTGNQSEAQISLYSMFPFVLTSKNSSESQRKLCVCQPFQDETPTSVFERLQDISLLLKDISNETGIAVSET